MTFSTVQIKPVTSTELAPIGAAYFAGKELPKSEPVAPKAEGIPGLSSAPPLHDPTRIPATAQPQIRISDFAAKVLRCLHQQGGAIYGDPATQIATALGADQQAVLLALVELNRAGFVESKYA